MYRDVPVNNRSMPDTTLIFTCKRNRRITPINLNIYIALSIKIYHYMSYSVQNQAEFNLSFIWMKTKCHGYGFHFNAIIGVFSYQWQKQANTNQLKKILHFKYCTSSAVNEDWNLYFKFLYLSDYIKHYSFIIAAIFWLLSYFFCSRTRSSSATHLDELPCSTCVTCFICEVAINY